MGTSSNAGIINVHSQNIINNKNIKGSILSLNKPVSESVLDLVNCFICISPAVNPVSCPKCNNFACNNCFTKIFEGKLKASCPICKNEIISCRLEKKTIIGEIENILYQNKNKEEKIEHLLSKLAEEKKKLWDEQTSTINQRINRIKDYQKNYVENLSQQE